MFLELLLSSLSCQILVNSNVKILQEKQKNYIIFICWIFVTILRILSKIANNYKCYATV